MCRAEMEEGSRRNPEDEEAKRRNSPQTRYGETPSRWANKKQASTIIVVCRELEKKQAEEVSHV